MKTLSQINYETIQNNVPSELKNLPQWVSWSERVGHNGRTLKLPVSPVTGRAARINDPDTWASFEEALAYSRKNDLTGVGFVFTEGDDFVGVDLDRCIDLATGAVRAEAVAIVNQLASYTEISPSGGGLHVLVRGKLPQGPRRGGPIEIYDDKRFFTVTGRLLPGAPSAIADRQDQLLELYREAILRAKAPAAAPTELPKEGSAPEGQPLLTALRSQAEKFDRLMRGDFEGYPSQSEADLALCRLLAFQTRWEARKIDEIFRRSGLYRPKWDQPHTADGKSYGQATIEKALSAERAFRTGASEDASPAQPEFNLTDLGNAERLACQFGERIAYCQDWKKWLVYNGANWAVDHTDQVRQLAKQVIRDIYIRAADIKDPSRRQAIVKHALASESDRRIRSMISLAESEVPVIPEDLDRDPWLFNCLNGTLDLECGILRPHDPASLITKIAPVTFEPTMPCPRWLAFLDRIMDGNVKLIAFLQRAIGYAMTGLTSEQCLFIFYGSGANGKSTFLQAISFVLGHYAMSTPTETLLVRQRGATLNDIARLKGARFVTASEAEAEQRLAESLIKQMTGGDTISARFLYQEWFDLHPTHKIFIGTNHKPVIKGTDHAIWRRIRLVPFEVTIPEAERDRQLLEKLREEADGIFAWAVEGCLLWQKHGLGVPEEVKAATEDYREEMDILAEFISDRCVVQPASKVPRGDLYDAYTQWCQANGQESAGNRVFASSMRDRGFRECRMGMQGVRGWAGLRLEPYPGSGQIQTQE
jgi:putative DNA primase/helicase